MSHCQAVSALSSSQCRVPRSQRLPVRWGPARVVMRRKDIHPEYYKEAKVFCKGEHVLTVNGTQDEYHVDVWSGNHPFFQGKETQPPANDGPLRRFREHYAGLPELMKVPTFTDEQPPEEEAQKENLEESKK